MAVSHYGSEALSNLRPNGMSPRLTARKLVAAVYGRKNYRASTPPQKRLRRGKEKKSGTAFTTGTHKTTSREFALFLPLWSDGRNEPTKAHSGTK